MAEVLVHEHIIPIKGVKKKIIYHFSDSHLTEFDELSDQAETEKAQKQTAAWENVRSGFASAYGEPYGEGQKASGKEHFENLINTATDGDALVIAGDTLDYMSGANLRLAEKEFGKIKCPFIAVCGNHEKADEIPDGTIVSPMKLPVQKVDLGDLIIIGFDNSKRVITREQIDALNTAYGSGKAVIVAFHVPIMTAENEQALRKAGEYFQLNYDGCPKENLEFIDIIIKHASQTAAVLAGHLHFNNITEITNGVTQYVSTQGITGNINRYVVGE